MSIGSLVLACSVCLFLDSDGQAWSVNFDFFFF